MWYNIKDEKAKDCACEKKRACDKCRTNVATFKMKYEVDNCGDCEIITAKMCNSCLFFRIFVYKVEVISLNRIG